MSSARCHSFRGYCPPRRRPRWSWRSTPTGQRRSPWEDIVVRSRRDASPASLDVLDLALDGVETSRQLLELGAESLRELAHGLDQAGRDRAPALGETRHPAQGAGGSSRRHPGQDPEHQVRLEMHHGGFARRCLPTVSGVVLWALIASSSAVAGEGDNIRESYDSV